MIFENIARVILHSALLDHEAIEDRILECLDTNLQEYTPIVEDNVIRHGIYSNPMSLFLSGKMALSKPFRGVCLSHTQFREKAGFLNVHAMVGKLSSCLQSDELASIFVF